MAPHIFLTIIVDFANFGLFWEMKVKDNSVTVKRLHKEGMKQFYHESILSWPDT